MSIRSIKAKILVVPAAFALFLLAFSIRLSFIDETSVMTDEPLYIEAGRIYVKAFTRLDFSYETWRLNAEHPPLAKLLVGLATYILQPILGADLHGLYFSARIISATIGSLICSLLYLLGRKSYGEASSFLAAVLSSLSPWMIYYSTLGILDIFVAFFITLTFLTLNLVEEGNRAHLLLGVFLGLALACKGTAIGGVAGLLVYAILSKIQQRKKSKKEEETSMVSRGFSTLALAGLTFYAVWPWLWPDPVGRLSWTLGYHLHHMASGHTTFYAGTVYEHVPPWVATYILFVKNPVLIFFSSLLFTFYVLARLATGKPVPKSYLSLTSWILGGILALSCFPILIGDHYILFLAPAIHLSASVLASDVTRVVRRKWMSIVRIFLTLIMILELVYGIYLYRASPGAYVNELINEGDKAIIMIDTGYEDSAEFLVKTLDGNPTTVSAPYVPTLLSIEFKRKGIQGFKVVEVEHASEAEYMVVPVLYARRFGLPETAKKMQLIYIVRSGRSMLAYIFKANKTIQASVRGNL